MTQVTSAGTGRQELAWLVTAPTFVLAAGLAALWLVTPIETDQLWVAALFLGMFMLAQATSLHFEVGRHSFTPLLTDLPLVLALFYLPPILVLGVRVTSLVVVLLWQRYTAVKLFFNLASVGLSTTVGAMIVAAQPPVGVGPRTWLILGAAVAAGTVISLAAVIGVITLVQGVPPAKSLLRTTMSVATMAAVNISVGLVVLILLHLQPWSILLLLGLGAVLVVVYRSYAQFVRQHRSLSELYELTRAMGDASRNGTLSDVLLGRVRQLLQAEYATLWLPAQGRYPEMLLSARVDAPGLLDVSNTPAELRQRALSEAGTVTVGPKVGDPDLQALMRGSGVKDAIVAPLRSGTAVIGSLEVTGRLGDLPQFGAADVQLLEMLAAQAAVAVENSRLIDRLRFDAYHDALTSLPNRRRLLALLDEALKVRTQGEVVAALLVDIDGLADVNESLGHDAGDHMISEVATRLRRIAPAAAMVGRPGSDEFLVTLRLPDADKALSLANRLRAELQEPLLVDSITLDVDVAIGVAVAPEHATEPEAILKCAALAAEAAKQL
ncbi:MAG TPA: diguanylate cyclase, partial [Micromonosporaceae bacterium]